jgi:hypothetical protein
MMQTNHKQEAPRSYCREAAGEEIPTDLSRRMIADRTDDYPVTVTDAAMPEAQRD